MDLNDLINTAKHKAMQLMNKKPQASSRVGLMIQPDQLLLVNMDVRDGRPYLLHGRQVALESESDGAAALKKLVKDLDIEGMQVSYVLNPSDYNLHLVEAPNVEDEELAAAMRWKVKDLLDIKVEDAAIEVFKVPQDAYRGREMVYVVATPKSKIRNIIKTIDDAGLELAIIDIPELAMLNVAKSCIEDKNGIAFMDLRRTGSTMNISIDGDLYLTRRINTQVEPEALQSISWSSLKDRLVLEIQRSLDYYESQMSRPQITKIVVAQRQFDTAELCAELDELLVAQVGGLDLSSFIKGDEMLTPEFQQRALSAIGATLRGMGEISELTDEDLAAKSEPADEVDVDPEPEAA